MPAMPCLALAWRGEARRASARVCGKKASKASQTNVDPHSHPTGPLYLKIDSYDCYFFVKHNYAVAAKHVHTHFKRILSVQLLG